MSEPACLHATRAAYDAVAADYTWPARDELDTKPLDRAVLAAFAERARAADAGPVADPGCGPGRVPAHPRDLGLNYSGRPGGCATAAARASAVGAT
ncbi:MULTISPECIES: hypothetical protein [unclassified Streptomyces]|uniref:hypothetical protein n=1 Tax=unclassified Streptomyces TaxID=2593676 RepID=UPI003FA38AD8